MQQRIGGSLVDNGVDRGTLFERELDVLDGPAQREATHLVLMLDSCTGYRPTSAARGAADRRDLLQLELEVGRASFRVTGEGEADVQRGGACRKMPGGGAREAPWGADAQRGRRLAAPTEGEP